MEKGGKIIGLSIGGTKCSISLGAETEDGSLEIYGKKFFPTRGRGAMEVLPEFCRTIDCLCEKPAKIGVVCGGPLDERAGVILSPPNLHGWDEVYIVDYLENRFGVKTKLLNDANAGALAEWQYGAGRGCDNIVFLTFGTGIGAGLIFDGRLISGANGMAGEIGHVRLSECGGVGYGKVGSVEGFVSGGGIAQTGRRIAEKLLSRGKKCTYVERLIDLDKITAKDIAEKAAAGGADALEAMRETGERLGETLAILTDLLNPERIVIGGIYARNEKLLSGFATPVYERESLPRSREVCSVVAAKLGERIDEYASLCTAIYDM